ncbi:MAG TPA: beta-propeller fold lactonase family protein [Terriglobales bacterium]|nr:beta-propeller fold lactonase family protein [Terriglobales bacterium]
MRNIGFLVSAVIVLALALATLLWPHYLQVLTNVAYVSEEEGGISVINLSTLRVTRRVQPSDVAPRGLAVSLDGKYVMTSNKNTSDMAVFSTPSLRLLKRIHIGESPEFIKINPAGDRIFATFEPSSDGGPPGAAKADTSGHDENGAPAQIASFHIGDWAPGPVSTAGHETEGIEFSRDGKLMLVANESQETIGVFEEATGRHLREVDLKAYGNRPRGIKVSPQGNLYAVTMESSGTLLTMGSNFNVIKSVLTAAKPYGVAFDRAGKRVFVSAALVGKLQVFAADSLQLLAEVPTGKRCWHFTFTPDDSRILLACGRSNNVVVIDASSYKLVETIEGFKLPWGIVTYPRSYGSLGLP